jgi:hypothetical protein
MFRLRSSQAGRESVVQEPADLGTAFGLDACLEGSEQNAHPGEPEARAAGDASWSDESPLAWLLRRSAVNRR